MFDPDMLRSALGNKWICWGIMPQLFGMIGYFGTMLSLEAALGQLKTSMVRYGSKTREECARETQKRVPKWTQLKTSLWNILGPSAILSTVLLVFIMDYWMPKLSEHDAVFPAPLSAIIDFVVCFVVADFFLYWGHRIQHMNEWLWRNFHSLHHQLDTPTPIGTGYVHSMDAKIQTEAPLIFSALIWKPHPLTWSVVVACKISESVFLHSGSEHFILSAVTLRFLPFRAEVRHHDSHHKYSNYSRNSKNYGEAFWIWDWIFGTLSTQRQ
jgi:sterol desaturase/sphingolipid hydroxylase (fatty acid hydroxylase superfamily)